jgi:hypothetical protein
MTTGQCYITPVDTRQGSENTLSNVTLRASVHSVNSTEVSVSCQTSHVHPLLEGELLQSDRLRIFTELLGVQGDIRILRPT